MNVQPSLQHQLPSRGSSTTTLQGGSNPIVIFPQNPVSYHQSLQGFNIPTGLSENKPRNILPLITSQPHQGNQSNKVNNHPSEFHTNKRLINKPPLIKQLAMDVTAGGVSGVVSRESRNNNCALLTTEGKTEDNGITATTNKQPLLACGLIKPPHTTTDTRKSSNETDCSRLAVEKNLDVQRKSSEADNSRLSHGSPALVHCDHKSKRISQISYCTASDSSTNCSTPTPPPLPERTDSLNNQTDDELRFAPWFQAGIPREITLEVLGQEPVGAFMVRESTTKPGCYALSLRVPKDFQPTGIAHYLIMRTNKGFKIKGFTKEFSTLTALITHHSVMPELLPCPLSLSRYNPLFSKSDSSREFADINSDPDYNALSDFQKVMASLNI